MEGESLTGLTVWLKEIGFVYGIFFEMDASVHIVAFVFGGGMKKSQMIPDNGSLSSTINV